MQLNTMVRFATALAAALVLVRCGGGTDGTGSVPPGAQSVVIGVMTKGSVIVNGIRFDDGSATIRIDNTAGTPAQLATGMFVKVLGRINADNVSGVADRVEAENEVRGPVQSVNAAGAPPSFTVAGLTVFVGASTVFANLNPNSFSVLRPGLRVEVQGLRDPAGNVRASRISAASDASDELKGIVANLNVAAHTFTLGSTTVNFAAVTAAPSLANGVAVEVHGTLSGSDFNATSIDREDQEDAVFQPSNGGRFKLEGFVSGLNAQTGAFQIGTRTVQTTASTSYEGGSSADLANGLKVEAEGTLDASGALVATRIEFEDGSGSSSASESSGVVRLTGIAAAVNSGARTVTLFGRIVQINDLTEIDSNLLNNVVPGTTRLDVRAAADASGNLVAQEIEIASDSRDVVQARVTAKDTSTFRLTLLDTIVAALGGNVQFHDATDATISRDQFFSAVTPRSSTAPGTLVKVTGTFSGGSLNATRADLEN